MIFIEGAITALEAGVAVFVVEEVLQLILHVHKKTCRFSRFFRFAVTIGNVDNTRATVHVSRLDKGTLQPVVLPKKVTQMQFAVKTGFITQRDFFVQNPSF